MRLAQRISIMAVFALICGACVGPPLSSEAAKSVQLPPALKVPPSLDELKNATYSGLAEVPGTVTLQNGLWTGPPSAPGSTSRPVVEIANDFRVLGDLNGDRLDEAVAVLTYSSGGSGSFSYLAVMSRGDGSLHNVATAGLGDRVQLRSVRIDGGKLLVRGVRAGINDAACCPGDLVEWQWTLSAGKLITPGMVTTGRISLTTLAGTEWVLRAWDITERAGSEPVVTLAYDAGRVSGTSGCNRYSGSATEGTTPGEFSVGLLAGTRMACEPTQSSVETRFLDQLSGAKTFGFMLGRLMISYARTDGSRGTMLFDARTPSK